jgi:hypothetical protein
MKRLVLLASILTALSLLALSAAIPTGHHLLHIKCPPGSHGVIRAEGVGRSLMDARNMARGDR